MLMYLLYVHMNSYIHELLIVFTLTRFHLWFWNILVVNNRWFHDALVPNDINFTQALWAQVIAYLMAHLMVMYSLKVVSWYALHPFTNFMNTMWSFIRCAPGLCSRASVILDLIISPLTCIVNFDFLLMTL